MRILLALAALAGVAHADGDRAFSVGGNLGTFSVPAPSAPGSTPSTISPDFGLGLDVAYQHGISSDVSLHAAAAGTYFNGGAQKGQSDNSYAVVGDVGFLFKLDVLKYVPYAFADVGLIGTFGGVLAGDSTYVLTLGGGLEVMASRERSWGVELRLASFASNVTVATLGYHRSFRWGFF